MENEDSAVVFEEGQEKVMLKVCISDDGTQYRVFIPGGSSVPETAFCMAVIIKCMQRDGIIEDKDAVIALIRKYLDDPQYQEVEADEPNDNNVKEVDNNDTGNV